MSTGPLDPSSPFESHFDHLDLQTACRDLWESTGIHRWDSPHADPDGPVFSVDTPPPYVSAAHLHVGHAMSYTQAEIIVRYKRMTGHRIHYPMGFDDNGLPTERYVERAHDLDASSTPRSEFRALCLDETRRGAETYAELWRSLGLSVDWSLSYSTIDDHSRHTAQWSFLELFEQGRITRTQDPVLWDPTLQSSLAQADIETRTRRQKLHAIRLNDSLTIATTRPELLPACVAMYHHPDDTRYAGLTEAPVPLFDRTVPVLADREVDPHFGTGLMMVCTFGDAEDVRRWRRDGLDLRIAIGPDGRMTELAGPYAGLDIHAARKRIVADLKAAGAHAGFEMTEQSFPVGERTGTPVEWRPQPQWFLRVLDLKDRMLARSAELRWHPEWMKSRLDDWIGGLQWDWNLSRQRSYGVPFPVWLCDDCGKAVLARAEDLPVDPLEDPPPLDACPDCGGALHGDPDVMDTWMTSSLTPEINANRVGTPGRPRFDTPQTVRVQAFEIIRTWLFYTLVKSELHDDRLPWRDVMISGWGLNEQGRKISKRDLQKTAEGEFNRYDPAHLIAKYGADALRHWAAHSHLGQDLRYHEKHVRTGRKTAVKLWNAGRLGSILLEGFDPAAPHCPIADRAPEDRHLLHQLDACITTVRDGLERYDYATGLRTLDRWFFADFCDNWLEAIKDRIAHPEQFPTGSDWAAQATLHEALRTAIGLYAPYLPFATEGLWHRLYRSSEGGPSIHVTRFPEARGIPSEPGMELVAQLRTTARQARTELRIPQSRSIPMTIRAPEDLLCSLRALEPSARAACRATALQWELADALEVELVA